MRSIDNSQNHEIGCSVQWLPEQRQAILEEMSRLLDASVFKKSHRCVVLLRAIIEHSLAGDHYGIKERTLGIEVFGREANYDSNSDPVVRMTANEIRKRLAQYYQESDPEPAVKIRLLPGSYIPEFNFVQTDPENGDKLDAVPPELSHHSRLDSAPSLLRAFSYRALRYKWLLVVASLLLLTCIVIQVAHSDYFKSTQYLIWKPLLSSRVPLILCVADNSDLEHKNYNEANFNEQSLKVQAIAEMIETRKAPTIQNPENFHPVTPFSDANVAYELAHWLDIHDQQSRLRSSSVLSLKSFHESPVVLIGGLDNPWTVIMLSKLRYSPRVNSSGWLWIRDAQNPASQEFSHNVTKNDKKMFDYAVLARFFDPESGNWILAIGGIGAFGTEAASHLIVDSGYEHVLPKAIRTARNFEIVVKTNIINGNAGPPQIVAYYTW